MRSIVISGLVVALGMVSVSLLAQDIAKGKREKKNRATVSFKKDVFPIIERRCLPCHAEENFNPSELSLDSYELMKTGGKHGEPWIPGKSSESILIQKLSEDPPFGDRMPLNTKKDIKARRAKWLSPEEVKVLSDWVDQGAKDN